MLNCYSSTSFPINKRHQQTTNLFRFNFHTWNFAQSFHRVSKQSHKLIVILEKPCNILIEIVRNVWFSLMYPLVLSVMYRTLHRLHWNEILFLFELKLGSMILCWRLNGYTDWLFGTQHIVDLKFVKLKIIYLIIQLTSNLNGWNERTYNENSTI